MLPSDDEMWKVFTEFLDCMNPYPVPIAEFPSYSIDRFGNVFDKNNEYVKPYHYDNQYDSVYLKENGRYGKRDIHVLVSKTFNDDYFSGCVVHHRDENKYNNVNTNLVAETKSEHARHHADPSALNEWSKTHSPANKGKKMSPEFCEKCRISAIKRAQREREENIKRNSGSTYRGNQFRNADGTKKEVDKEWYEKFRESCRQGALKRNKK